MFRALANKLFGGRSESKAVAKSRLHFVLVQDRTGLTTDQMANFRKELVEVIQRYFVIDEQGFDINYERKDESTTLVINSPVVVKRQEALKGAVGTAAAANGSRPNTSANPSTGNPSSRPVTNNQRNSKANKKNRNRDNQPAANQR